jgi:hypothetical protein
MSDDNHDSRIGDAITDPERRAAEQAVLACVPTSVLVFGDRIEVATHLLAAGVLQQVQIDPATLDQGIPSVGALESALRAATKRAIEQYRDQQRQRG